MDNMIVPRRGAIRSQPRPVSRDPRPLAPRRPYRIEPSQAVASESHFAQSHNHVADVKPAVVTESDHTVEKPSVAPRFVANESISESPATKASPFVWRWVLGSLAVVVLAITGYVSIDTWRTNTKVAAEYNHTSKADVSSTGTNDSSSEGKDETPLPDRSLVNYKVAADMPRALYIGKLKIAARILPMSVNNDGSIQAPKNIYDAGWYNASAKPGTIGAVFIDGHASGPTRQGLFAYLDTLKTGDLLRLEKGDGTSLDYRVVHTDTVPLANFDMNTMLRPQNGVLKGLNIMTCTGKWLPDKETYDHRVTIYAEQVTHG